MKTSSEDGQNAPRDIWEICLNEDDDQLTHETDKLLSEFKFKDRNLK